MSNVQTILLVKVKNRISNFSLKIDKVTKFCVQNAQFFSHFSKFYGMILSKKNKNFKIFLNDKF